MDFLASPEFWLALGQIIIIDILLGGDNAVVIALACRKLPPAQRTKGIIWGTAGAIILRVILIAFAMTLLALPFLKFVGAILLVWIGVKLLAPDEEGHGDVQGSDKLLAAIKTIIVADLVMSVDNVIAIAGAAQNAGEHSFLLVVLGLWSLPLLLVPPVLSADAVLYADLGWIVHQGQNPYLVGLTGAGGPYAPHVDPPWAGGGVAYPPLALLINAAVRDTKGKLEDRAAVRKALGADAIVGTYCRASRHDGMTAAEIGARLSITPATARQRITRARKALAGCRRAGTSESEAG